MQDKKIERIAANLDVVAGFDPGYDDSVKFIDLRGTEHNAPAEEKISAEDFAKAVADAEPALSYGPLRKAPTYYIGESIGCNGKGSFYGRALTARRDTERLKNGALPGIRNKAARRMLRKAFRNAYSKTEQSILKARDLVNEVRGYADSGHEGKRNIARLDAAHTPAKVVDNRAARQQMRKARKHHKKQWAKAIDRMSKALVELGNA